MIADKRGNVGSFERAKLINRSISPVFKKLEKRRFAAKNVFRKHPVIAGFHRGIDGAIIGVLSCTALMSALALHSQYLWTLSFGRLEMTRDLNSRLEESIVSLERYFLETTTLTQPMVATKTSHLLYLDAPSQGKKPINFIPKALSQFNRLITYPIPNGY